MKENANASFPYETGGSLMGYYSDRGRSIIVANLIGSGPEAKHRKTSFVPDYRFQEEEIKKIYEKSGRIYTYLGDWHTHPEGSSVLSGKDMQTLENISAHDPARVPFPIMVLLSGVQESWNIKSWQLKFRRVFKFLFQKHLIELEIKYY